MRDWVTNIENTFYIIGTVAGPHPYPMLVRDFQSVIGEECLVQMPEMTGRQPDYVMACIGGGSNAMGIFYPYIDQKQVRLIGVEAAGEGLDGVKHAASLTKGYPGVLHGNRTYLLQDENGQIIETHSVSAGLDYPGVGPEHAYLKDIGRAEYVSITDDEALKAFHDCCHIAGVRGEAGGDLAERSDHSGQPVGPWRQGHAHRGGADGTQLQLSRQPATRGPGSYPQGTTPVWQCGFQLHIENRENHVQNRTNLRRPEGGQ
jgi:hypothetical protein